MSCRPTFLFVNRTADIRKRSNKLAYIINFHLRYEWMLALRRVMSSSTSTTNTAAVPSVTRGRGRGRGAFRGRGRSVTVEGGQPIVLDTQPSVTSVGESQGDPSITGRGRGRGGWRGRSRGGGRSRSNVESGQAVAIDSRSSPSVRKAQGNAAFTRDNGSQPRPTHCTCLTLLFIFKRISRGGTNLSLVYATGMPLVMYVD